jgi:hypothetical protein
MAEVTIRFLVRSEAGAVVASDVGELASGLTAPPTPALEIRAVTRADAMPAVEILSIARGDVPFVDEAWCTYVVAVTLTLSDGRVITYGTLAAPTAA